MLAPARPIERRRRTAADKDLLSAAHGVCESLSLETRLPRLDVLEGDLSAIRHDDILSMNQAAC